VETITKILTFDTTSPPPQHHHHHLFTPPTSRPTSPPTPPSPPHTTNTVAYITIVTSSHYQSRCLHHHHHLFSPLSPLLGQIETKTKWIRTEHRRHEQRTTKRIALQRTDPFRINTTCRRRYSGHQNRASTIGRKKPPPREPTQKVMWMVGPSSHHQTTLFTS